MFKSLGAVVLAAVLGLAALGENQDKLIANDWEVLLAQFPILDKQGISEEAVNLKIRFAQEVSQLSVDDFTDNYYSQWAKIDALKRLQGAAYPLLSQYLVFVDRNPKKQLAMVGYYSQETGQVEIIGWDKCSTGNPTHGRDYHFTPTGVFANTIDHFSFRAAGTKNKNGWRGYGRKNCRVWDFGYQATTKPIKGREQAREIRLLMHATDPDNGEPKLGTPQSKGCVRISDKLDKFLDFYGIIDAEYEADIFRKSVATLLLQDRMPAIAAGKYLIIGDSAQ